jgi:3-hydroxybutyryl-CoA dehydrogenase
MELHKIGVAGFGTMGSEIALLAAMAGFDTVAYDAYAPAFDANLPRLAKLLRVLQKDLDDAGREAVLARLKTSPDASALNDCDLIIEAVVEDFAVKEELLSGLGKACKPEAIIATNTSSLGVTRLAATSGRPERFIGLHFFNPPSQMSLVEVVPGLLTGKEVGAAALDFVNRIGKKPIFLRKETPGFIVNRVLMAMAVEAMSLAEQGIGSPQEIDEALRRGAGWPLGPFKLMDLVGLDVFLSACEGLYRELGEAKFRPPFMLKQQVEAGRFGRKTRAGFYDY